MNQLGNMFVPPEKRKREIELKHENQRRDDITVILRGSHFKKITHDPCLPRCIKGERENTFRGQSEFVDCVLGERFRLRLRLRSGILPSTVNRRIACYTDLKFLW